MARAKTLLSVCMGSLLLALAGCGDDSGSQGLHTTSELDGAGQDVTSPGNDAGVPVLVDAHDDEDEDGAELIPEVGPIDEPDGDESPSEHDGSSVASDTGVSDSLSPPEDSSTAKVYGGGVVLSEINAPPIVSAFATVRFTDQRPLLADDATLFEGGCAVAYGDPNAEVAPDYGYDAGTIAVVGTQPELSMAPADEGANGTGYESGLSEDHETLLPPPGGLITITGDGGEDIAPFSVIVQAPLPVNLSSPSSGDIASAKAPLTVTWNAGDGDSILLTLTPLQAFTFQPTAGPAMACATEEDLGSFTVPAAALEMVRDGAMDRAFALGLTRIRQAQTSQGPAITATASRSSGGLLRVQP